MKRYIINILIIILFFVPKHSLSQDSVQDSARIQSLIESLYDYKSVSKFNRNIEIIDSAINLSSNDNKLLIKTLLLKSEIYRSLSKFDTALIINNKALQIADENNLEKEKADVYQNFAFIYQRNGELNKAIDFALKPLIIYENYNDSNSIARTYTLLGVLNANLGDIDSGIEYFKKSLEIYYNNNNVDQIAANLLNIGTAYFFSDRLEKAKTLFLEALELTDKNKLIHRNILLANLATIYQHQNKLDSANYYQVKAINGAQKSEDMYLLSTMYYNASTTKFQQNDYDSAYYYANKGLDISVKLNLFNQQIDNLLMISQVDSIRLNTNAELADFKKIVSLKDSLLIQVRKSIANEIETKYQNFKKDDIIKLQQKNLSIVEDKNNLFRILITISIILLVIVLLLLTSYRKLYLKSRKLYQLEKTQIKIELKEKEKELVSIALQMEQKNLLITSLYEKIKNSCQMLNNNENELKSILSDIKSSLNVHKDIKLFSEKFAQLHHDFIGELKSKFPELTMKEIKLLSFLKIGLSTKQIASIQNITSAAVHKMRYRIKKKINLTMDDSLDNFVAQL